MTRPAAFLEITPDHWGEVVDLCYEIRHWIFRGQTSFEWGLSGRLERLLRAWYPSTELIPQGEMRRVREEWILHQFQRRARNYLHDVPQERDTLEWLALLQHYGGATRLIDFTHSFFIASFFALEFAEGDAGLWCLNTERLVQACDKFVSKPGLRIDLRNKALVAAANEVLQNDSQDRLILPVEPESLNERISLQQGVFAMPATLDLTFEECLCEALRLPVSRLSEACAIRQNAREVDPSFKFQFSIVKVKLPQHLQAEAVWDLTNMNITAMTLFPGLDGFARSLVAHLRPPSPRWSPRQRPISEEP